MNTIKTFPLRHKVAVGASALLLAATCAMPLSNAQAETSEEAQASASAAYEQLVALQAQQNEKSETYVQALNEYQAAVTERDNAQARIDEIQDRITEIQGNLGNRARTMYRDGFVSLLDVFFGSATFDDFAQSLNILDRINQNDAKNIQESKDLKEEAKEQHAVLEQAASEAEAKANEASAAYEEVTAAMNEMQATYDSLSAEAQALCQEEAAASAAALAAAAAEYGATYNSDGSITDASGTTYRSVSAYAAATGNSIVDRARAMIGSSYVWGGTGADGTFDCSGLVGYAITGETTRIGNTTTYMGWTQVDPYVGAIVVNDGHTGVVSGVNDDGSITVIHAMDEDNGVVESTWSSDYYNSRGYIFVEP